MHILRSAHRIALAETGGVFAAAHTDLLSLSGLMTLTAAIALPAADLTGRAVQGVIEKRRNVRRSAFYYLHRVGQAAAGT